MATIARLEVKSPAPQFELQDVFGRPVSLNKLRNKYVVLAFLRYSGCSFCNLTLHRLTMEYPMFFRQNCEVIAFVQSTEKNIIRNIYQKHPVRPQFPIIADPKMEIFKRYGVQRSIRAAAASIKDVPHWVKSIKQFGLPSMEFDSSLLLVPALFLVAPRTQKIIQAEYGTSFYNIEAFNAIHERLLFNVDD